ncbi:MAG TPA: PQQ-binding-like beta-propeller repeat protein [Patescibacteria group bacterium]|nr:PQQ-binding-like beta-propeller repeat protein [Patescibacteria group bacterium]
MKTKVLFLVSGLFIFCSCRGSRPALIPEISPPLVQKEVCTWSGRLAGDILFPCAGGVGWVDAAGKIVTWDAEKKTTAVVFELSFPITVPPFHQGDFLVLKDKASDHLLVYDLAELKVKFESRNMRVGQILAVDRDSLVYLDGEHLAIHLWEKPSGIFRMPEPAEKIFSCHFSPDRILILGREHLFTFWKASGKFQAVLLPRPAVSAFFCDGKHIYYGDAKRHLVKFSLSKNRLVWKLKLGQPLERQPFAFAGSIVINPSDNNILQVNARGTVRWWLALQSTMRFDLLSMNDNLVAVLLNRDIEFINLGQKQVAVFKSQGLPVSKPLVFGHDLYFMLQEGATYKLQCVGNRYGIDVELDPANVKWTGQSIRFSIQSHNLLKPSFDFLISDQEGRVILNKSAETAERIQLVWIPVHPGKYTIKVMANGLNRQADVEVPFQVLDPQKAVSGFYLHF